MKDVAQREPMLVALLKRQFTSETIIFCEKKSEAHRLQIVLGLLGLHCAELHGDLNQTQRLQALGPLRQEGGGLFAGDRRGGARAGHQGARGAAA